MKFLKLIYYTLALLLEIGMVVSFFIYGFHLGTNIPASASFGLGLSIVSALFWGLFQAPRARYRVGLVLRMIFEIILFSAAAYILYSLHYTLPAYLFAGAILIKEALTIVFKGE